MVVVVWSVVVISVLFFGWVGWLLTLAFLVGDGDWSIIIMHTPNQKLKSEQTMTKNRGAHAF